MMKLTVPWWSVLACLLVAGCGEVDEPVTERLRPVRFVTVSDDNVFRDRSFTGTSKASLESRLSFKVPGTVNSLPVQIGQRLAAGELIAALDPASYQLQQQQARASLVEAEANERRAAANYERTKGLYANDNASLNDLESARAQAESAEAVSAVPGRAARASVTQARATLREAPVFSAATGSSRKGRTASSASWRAERSTPTHARR